MINPYALAIALAAATGAGVYYFTRRREATKTLPPIFTEKPPSQPDLDGLSSQVAKLVAALEESRTATPQQVANAAAGAREAGLEFTAMRLEQNALWRARKLAEKLAAAPPTTTPAPARHTVAVGDTGATIAKKYTGDATRWGELVGQPTTAGALVSKTQPYDYKTGQEGFVYLSPWVVGMRIVLPASWTGAAASPSADWAKL